MVFRIGRSRGAWPGMDGWGAAGIPPLGASRRRVGPTRFTVPDSRNAKTPTDHEDPHSSVSSGGLRVAWSCRESNPGPLALSQVFSGCSASCRFSQPWCSDEHVTNRLSHEKVPIASRDATRSASPLDETDDPGRGRSRVCPSPVAVRQRGRSQCAWNRHLWFATNVKEMTSRSLPASPESNDQSRNRSAPLELSTDTHLHRHGVSITVQPRDDTAHSSRHRTPPSVDPQRQQDSCGCASTDAGGGGPYGRIGSSRRRTAPTPGDR